MSKKRYKNPISCVYSISYKQYIYIGSTNIFSKRRYEHLWHLEQKSHPNLILQNIYNKHKIEIHFQIIEEVDLPNLIKKEQEYIDKYKKDKNFFLINILPVAGSTLGHIQSQETNERKRMSMMGKNKNKKRTEEQRLSQSKRQRGRKISDEWKQKISNSLKGRPSPNKPKRFIYYNEELHSFKDFANIMHCDLSNLYVTKTEYTEKKYGCKIIFK